MQNTARFTARFITVEVLAVVEVGCNLFRRVLCLEPGVIFCVRLDLKFANEGK